MTLPNTAPKKANIAKINAPTGEIHAGTFFDGRSRWQTRIIPPTTIAEKIPVTKAC